MPVITLEEMAKAIGVPTEVMKREFHDPKKKRRLVSLRDWIHQNKVKLDEALGNLEVAKQDLKSIVKEKNHEPKCN